MIWTNMLQLGGHRSHFLNEKDGRQPLRDQVLKALLPQQDEGPKLAKDEKKKDDAKKGNELSLNVTCGT